MVTDQHLGGSMTATDEHARLSGGVMTQRMAQFIDANPELETPFLVIDLDVVADRYRSLTAALPTTDVFYAVKANPAHEIVELLVQMGAFFDVASPGEVDLCLGLGADPARLSYGNTVKKDRDIAYAASRGIRIFTVDCQEELTKVISHAQGGSVFVRLATDGADADWPLSRKFGCTVNEAWPLMLQAAESGYAVGISFHVGSQQRNPMAWDTPIAEAATLLNQLREAGYATAGVNLGGGLPSTYTDPTPEVTAYGEAITALLHKHLSEFGCRTIIEPGRYLVGDSGVLRSEVVLVADRETDPGRRWVYLDIGMFNGLTEALGEAIRYQITHEPSEVALGPVVLAGPSCDSADVLYETYEYQLPMDLSAGSRLSFLATGAYTSSYSSVWFNGFEPLRSYFLPVTSESVQSNSLTSVAASDGVRAPGVESDESGE